ncbi:MAG TPA: PBP1A family penicillin-binding protein [Thermodesulfobacteriota bacterium]|nr:PBP1A family penicillin-binding protein [Deltaproteobacteria bacterium]HNR14885.1 PBP1A family penicillin-binding protein [Thermodesulfobacteriota bacterium]HNU72133.1 PBP1A family penicillin-binding protein [Thermodesulfobacteriota bacterium]HOC37702.1 PBP1A family penicillin-binding protein [Thermodesulfobacteriota bacterium]HQO77452.1 PBP1A family penicillin-binding protein [Thermodesulfobacteriota bacterium]
MKTRKIKSRRTKKSPLRFVLRWCLIYSAWALLFLFIGSVFYCMSLSGQIEERFSGRRWSIPSRVFSASTMLYPGQSTNRELFLNKLRRLGYRETVRSPKSQGEMHISDSAVDIFLRDLPQALEDRPGYPVRIRFSSSQIVSLQRLDSGESVPLLELEPEEITSFFGPERERRQLVALKQVPRLVLDAVMAAEDMRFYRHHGVDVLGVVRAMYVNVRSFAIRQGGSTITQQLAKSYFLTPERTLRRKLKEVLISVMLEGMYDKDQILEIYLNEIYLGQRGSVSINGVGEASLFYFGKPVGELNLAEAAAIAGLIRAPNYYSPYKNKERCRARRDQVLRAMERNRLISTAQMEAGLKTPLEPVRFAAYRTQAPYFVDYLSSQLNALYPPEALTGLGFSLYTTLDTQVQEAAEAALQRGLSRLERAFPKLKRSNPKERLQGAVLVMQPKTGHILAMVGGRDYSSSQFNRITQARRQPGSAFKPFVFLSGLDSFTPVSLLSNEPRSYRLADMTWEPHNYEPIPEGQVTIRRALAESINVATVDLAMRVGLDTIVNSAKTFQISTPLQPYPSLALGAFELIPLELARAYCAFAADGVLPYPLSLKEVIDERGSALERRHATIRTVISPARAFMMNSLLASVVEQGTARSLRDLGVWFPAAGKTGTTNEFRDAWFIGYTPDILALVWVGFDNGQSIYLSGARAALPIWADLMNSLPDYISGEWFRQPAGVVKRTICTVTGQLAIENSCLGTREEYFLEENSPAEYCSLHKPITPLEQILRGIGNVFKRF